MTNRKTSGGGALFLLCLVLSYSFGLEAEAHGDEFKTLRATQDAFRRVAKDIRPSLVRIETVGGSQPPQRIQADPSEENEEERRRQNARNLFRDTPGSSFTVADGPTTGLVYDRSGLIIASSFNFVRDPLVIFAVLHDGRRLPAELVARDKVRKIALLKVDADDLEEPVWKDAEDIRIGEWAVALGLGFGGDRPSVTAGIISAMDRMHGNAIQTDAKLSPANYGGPLTDIEGRVVGLCVPMAQRPGELAGVEFYDSGIGFVLPKKRIDEIVSVLKTGKSFYRGWLGISVHARRTGGAHINKIASPSPARAGGIRQNDRIRWAEGEKVDSFPDLVQAIYMIPAGEEVYITIERDIFKVLDYHHLPGDYAYADKIEKTIMLSLVLPLARNIDLGELPEQEEPEYGIFQRPPTGEEDLP
ncbi:MAG: S1C family serine protease [Phycisphaerae bacterium]